MAENATFTPDKNQELNIITYAQAAQNLLLDQFAIRDNLAMVDRYYMREDDFTSANQRARLANRAGNKKFLQDVTMPIVMPQVESALRYFNNVFVTGYPIFGVVSSPEFEDAAIQMQTIIQENSVTAKWVPEMIKFFRDGLKYNIHALEVEWQEKTSYGVDTDISKDNSAKRKNILWKGNAIKRMDMYNTFFDPRVSPADVSEKGEFAGYVEMYSRINLKQTINELFGRIPVDTVKRAFASGPSNAGFGASGTPWNYFIPYLNPYPLMNSSNLSYFDWLGWANPLQAKNEGLNYSGNIYSLMTLYARILPSDFGFDVPEKNTPQVWKFKIVNGTVCLWAERQNNFHNKIPILFGQPLDDGLAFQTKSFASNVMDYQDLGSAMWNGFIADKRKLIGDRMFYDPSRIRKQDIESTNPAAKIPVRASAFGKPVNEAAFPVPYRGEQTGAFLQGAQLVKQMADQANHQNAAQQGQFVKGNKTKKEFDDIMGNGDGTNQTMALMTEASVFVPLKEILKLNILQFQPESVIYNPDKKMDIKINPVDLRKAAVQFKVSDGMLPDEKILSTDEFTVGLQVIGSSPQIAAGYNLAPMFSYLMKTKGADLTPFEKSPLQVAFEQQIQQWQQIALEAVKAGGQVPPQPQMPPELVAELQAKQGTGGVNPNKQSAALSATQGS